MESDYLNLVDYSEQELLILYNCIPKIFNSVAISVNISHDHFSSGNKEILLIEDPKGKGMYWVISTQEEVHWLVPVPQRSRKINSHAIESLKRLFECQNSEQSNDWKFILKKLAKVSPSTNEKSWILEEAGFIDFGNSLSLEQIHEYIQKSQLQPELFSQVEPKNTLNTGLESDTEEMMNQAEMEISKLRIANSATTRNPIPNSITI